MSLLVLTMYNYWRSGGIEPHSVGTVDREIFNCRNFRLSNFHVKIFSSLQHTDEN